MNFLIFETKTDEVFSLMPGHLRVKEYSYQFQTDRQIGIDDDKVYIDERTGLKHVLNVKVMERITTNGQIRHVHANRGWSVEAVRGVFDGLRTFVGVNRRVVIHSFRVKIGKFNCLFVKTRLANTHIIDKNDQFSQAPLWHTLQTIDHKTPSPENIKTIAKILPNAIVKRRRKENIQIWMV